MKILQINKFFCPRGGTENYMFSLISGLEKNGHDIIGFSQKNKNNIKIKGEKFFISEIKLDKFYWKSIFKIGRIFYSFEAKKKIHKLIKKENPDIVHIHNIYHQISPSIIKEIKKANIPIVMTVHDFKLVSPSYTLWATKNIKQSKPLIARILMTLEYLLHKTTKVYKNNIDLFIAPSEFVKNQLTKKGFKSNKIIVLPHFVEMEDKKENNEDNYIIYFGRLDESKGLNTLIYAFSKIQSDVKLKIVGSGPQENKLRELTKKLNIENKIEFLSHKNKQELKQLISNSMFSVFPSLVHETFGLGVIESYILQKPVIASRVGAFVENINKETGILFDPENIEQLKKAINTLIENKDLRISMGKIAKIMAEEKFSSNVHIEKIINIYKSLNIEKDHYKLEQEYRNKILSLPKKSEKRRNMISEAYDNINILVNNYRQDGIRGHSESTFKMIKKIANKNDKILDYGCGTGELVNHLNKSGYNAFGFDISKKVAQEAEKKYNLKVKFISEDFYQVKDHYDIIIMDNVIEHIAPDEIKNVLIDFKNKLNTDGQLIVVTPHKFAGPHDISGKFLPLGSVARGLHLKEFNIQELESELKSSGYNNISGYLINPRLIEKLKLSPSPKNIWLKKSIVLEKIFSLKMLYKILKINRNLTRILVAILFPTILIAKK